MSICSLDPHTSSARAITIVIRLGWPVPRGARLFGDGWVEASRALRSRPRAGRSPRPRPAGTCSRQRELLWGLTGRYQCRDRPRRVDIPPSVGLEHSSVDKIPRLRERRCGSTDLPPASTEPIQSRSSTERSKSDRGDYRGSGYDRGHQAPAGNQAMDPALKDQTFFMSNFAPQRHF